MEDDNLLDYQDVEVAGLEKRPNTCFGLPNACDSLCKKPAFLYGHCTVFFAFVFVFMMVLIFFPLADNFNYDTTGLFVGLGVAGGIAILTVVFVALWLGFFQLCRRYNANFPTYICLFSRVSTTMENAYNHEFV